MPRNLISVAAGLAHAGNQQAAQAAGRTHNRVVAVKGRVAGARIDGEGVERRPRIFVGHPNPAANLPDADPDLAPFAGPIAMLNGVCKQFFDSQLDPVNQVRCDTELPAVDPNQVYDSTKLGGSSRKSTGRAHLGVGRNHGN